MNRHEKALDLLRKGTVIPAIPLVLDENRKFDEANQRRLVRYYLAAGVGGVAVAVHTTQFEIRLPEINLLAPVMKATAEEIDTFEAETGKTVIRIAGACGPATQAVAEAKLAKSLGFDAVLLSPGGLPDASMDELLRRTEAVAAEMPVIGFYLQPAVGGRKLPFTYWKALAEIDNVVAVKSAPFNRYQTLDLVRGVAMSDRSDQVALYTGNDDNIVVDLLTPFVFEKDGKRIEKHFAGGLLGHWSVWTNTVVKYFDTIVKARKSGSIPPALLTLAAEITDCNGVVFDVEHDFAGCIPGVHEVLRREGLMPGTWCLNPGEVLSPGQSEEITRVWEMYPHLNDDAFTRENKQLWK